MIEPRQQTPHEGQVDSFAIEPRRPSRHFSTALKLGGATNAAGWYACQAFLTARREPRDEASQVVEKIADLLLSLNSTVATAAVKKLQGDIKFFEMYIGSTDHREILNKINTFIADNLVNSTCTSLDQLLAKVGSGADDNSTIVTRAGANAGRSMATDLFKTYTVNYKVSQDLCNGCLNLGQFESLLAHLRNHFIAMVLEVSQIRDRVLQAVNCEAREAFDLGFVIDQLIRPPYLSAFQFEESLSLAPRRLDPLHLDNEPQSLPYLGNRLVQIGEIDYLGDWESRFAESWARALGRESVPKISLSSPDLLPVAIPSLDGRPDLVGARCACAEYLHQHAVETHCRVHSEHGGAPHLTDNLFAPAAAEIGGSGQPGPPLPAPLPPVVLTSSPSAPGSTDEMGRMRQLRFDALRRRVPILETERFADFGDNEFAFKLTNLVCERTRQRSEPFPYADLHRELWGERDDSPSALDKLRQHAMIANEAMNESIGFALRARRKIGYILIDLEFSPAKQKRKPRRK